MPVTWNIYHGPPDYYYLLSIVFALGDGGAHLAGATSSAATFISGIHTVILKGEIDIGPSGDPDSGIVHVVEVYQDNVLVARGKGYQLTLDALDVAFNSGHDQDPALLLVNQPMSVYGSDDDDELYSSPFNDAVFGNKGNDQIIAREGDDKLVGGRGNDQLFGLDGNDLIKGGKGRDELVGEDGFDILDGGEGRDVFSFVEVPLSALRNIDKIKDFSHAKDSFELSSFIFSSLELGALRGRYFREGKSAKDGDEHILYHHGKLSYDADGNGGIAQIQFAKLKGAPDIAANDFLVI